MCEIYNDERDASKIIGILMTCLTCSCIWLGHHWQLPIGQTSILQVQKLRLPQC